MRLPLRITLKLQERVLGVGGVDACVVPGDHVAVVSPDALQFCDQLVTVFGVHVLV